MCPVKSGSKSKKKLYSLVARVKRDKPTGEIRYSRNGRVVFKTEKQTGAARVLSPHKKLRSGDRVHYANDDGSRSGLSGTLKYTTRKEAGKYGVYGWSVTDHKTSTKRRS